METKNAYDGAQMGDIIPERTSSIDSKLYQNSDHVDV